MSIESMDNVHWIHGHCPVWLVSLDFVHGLTGLCPEYPWALSRLSTESMVNVHWVHRQCPGSPLRPWTFYRRGGSPGHIFASPGPYTVGGVQITLAFRLSVYDCWVSPTTLGNPCVLNMSHVQVMLIHVVRKCTGMIVLVAKHSVHIIFFLWVEFPNCFLLSNSVISGNEKKPKERNLCKSAWTCFHVKARYFLVFPLIIGGSLFFLVKKKISFC